MSRYIDADMIKIPKMETELDDTKMRCAIANTPTVDVVPVVHGYWEREMIKDNCGCNHCYYCCSECGKASDDEFDYYQNCGAKMDALAKDINVHCKTDEVTE